MLHPLTNIKITKYFNYEPRFNVVFSRDNLPKIKDGEYFINHDVYFDSFGIEYIPQEVLNNIKDKSIIQNIFRIQSDNSIMCGFYCITFIEYILAEKSLLENTNLFSPDHYKKNDKLIYKYFKTNTTKENVDLEFRFKK